jgi:hypothetical protein
MTNNQKSKRIQDASEAGELSPFPFLGVAREINVLGHFAARDWCLTMIDNVVSSVANGRSKFNTCMGVRSVNVGRCRQWSVNVG